QLNGAALSVNTGGTTTFGGSTALDSLSTDSDGSTAINGGSIFTSGSQTFNDSVTLGATTTLLSTGSGDISFASTLDSDGSSRDLRLTARGGDITFGGNVGQSSPLSLVTVFTAVNVNNFGNTFNANFLQTSGTGTTSLASVGTDTYDVTTFNIDL